MLNETSGSFSRAAEVGHTGIVYFISTRISREQQLVCTYELVFICLNY
jgi:hypothetical protein